MHDAVSPGPPAHAGRGGSMRTMSPTCSPRAAAGVRNATAWPRFQHAVAASIVRDLRFGYPTHVASCRRHASYHSAVSRSVSSRLRRGRQFKSSAALLTNRAQARGLVRVRIPFDEPSQPARPNGRASFVDDRFDGLQRIGRWTEVPASRVPARGPQAGAAQASGSRQAVPGRAATVASASGLRIIAGSSRRGRARKIRHQPIRRPVAATDHVAGARRRDADVGGWRPGNKIDGTRPARILRRPCCCCRDRNRRGGSFSR